MRLGCESAAVLSLLLGSVARAQDIGFITELDLFSSLAPCAASAIEDDFAFQSATDRCGVEETKLQSCICSKTITLSQVTSSVSSDISYSCGTVGTDDQVSASRVIDQYCNPDSTVTFSQPTENVVNAFITEVPQLTYLPPCAQSGLAYAFGNFQPYCPEAASLWAPCVCSKSGVADALHTVLSQSVRSSCSNGEDATAAGHFYSEYCAMNKGTTSFAKPAGPPGDMTYYISALPQFKSLRPCAKSGVASAVLAQTEWLCGSGPQALASCVCLKTGLFQQVASSLTGNVKEYCSSTAIADVTSALQVFSYYCSAAASKVVAKVTESVVESVATGHSQTGSQTGSQAGSRPSGAAATQAGASNGTSGGGVSQGAIIAASVLGAVVGIGIVAGLWLFCRRKRRQRSAAQASQQGNMSEGGAGWTYHQQHPHQQFHPELEGSGNKAELPTPSRHSISEAHGRALSPGGGATEAELSPDSATLHSPDSVHYGQANHGSNTAGDRRPQALSTTFSSPAPSTPAGSNTWRGGPAPYQGAAYELDATERQR